MTNKRLAELNAGARPRNRERREVHYDTLRRRWHRRHGPHRRKAKARRIRRKMAKESRRRNRR